MPSGASIGGALDIVELVKRMPCKTQNSCARTHQEVFVLFGPQQTTMVELILEVSIMDGEPSRCAKGAQYSVLVLNQWIQ
jgi:hypothetical protein